MDSSYAKFISEILKASPQLTQLYHIARVLESEEVHNEGLETLLNDSQKISKKKKSTESIPIEVEHDIQVMRSFEQFPKILKKQFLLPESLFDQKLLKRDLLIQTPVYKENRMSWDRVFKEASCETEEKRLKRQRTYLLLDRSSSTAKYERLSLIKAIALLHLQTHQKGQGEVYFRSFHHNPGPLAISKNEGELQDLVHEHLLPLEPEGQTQLQKVIMKALDDIQYTSLNENWEFLIMTDGLSVIEPGLILEKSKQVKFHFVLVGQDQETYSDKELREIFHQQNKAAYARIDATASERERLQMENNMESAFQKEKKQLPQKLKQEHIQNLKYLCEESDGRWITCSDLNEMQRSTAFKKDSLIDQLNALYKVLEDPNLSPLEREHYLEQILLLQDQLRQLKAQAGDSTEDLEAIDQELKQFLESHPELQDLILEQGLKARHFNPGGVGEETSIWLLLLNRFKQAVLNQFK